jgi:hypothetical protein
MVKIAFHEILFAETWEKEDTLDQVNLIESEEPSFKVKFGDFFCAVQGLDYFAAMLYAEKNFEAAIQSDSTLYNFIIKLHKISAKHLLLLSPGQEGGASGELAKIQPKIRNENGSLQETPTKLEDIQNSFQKFCADLQEKISFIANPMSAVRCAAFALGSLGKIHPFINGNGRTARILMNCILVHGQSVAINFDNKNVYYNACRYAGQGNLDLLERIIQKLTIARSIDLEARPQKHIGTIGELLMEQGSFVFAFNPEDNALNIINKNTELGVPLTGSIIQDLTQDLTQDQADPQLIYFVENISVQAYIDAKTDVDLEVVDAPSP